MKTPMQEHIEFLKKEWLIVKNLESLGYIGVALHIGDCIEHAKSMLEEEDDVSKQSELLKDFRKWWNEDNQSVCTTITHKDIERYLESL